ncbi:MAG TPA: hypothetical protein VGG45_19040 [Terracidiphilus sp.]
MDDFKGQCFVIQPFDGGRYDRLYEQVFKPAIEDAKLKPYRVDNDPAASIPIETIEAEITRSLACFAEISEDNPNVWFELGYAIARNKPLCMVSSDARQKFPFDVQHRKIIRYPAHALPNDFTTLKDAITERLVAVIDQEESRRQNAVTANALAVAPPTKGLAPHEWLALTLIFEDQFFEGTNAWSLAESMKRSGFMKSETNLAATGLLRKNFVVMKSVEDSNGYLQDRFFVTEKGQDWLLSNQQKLNLRITKLPKSTIASYEDDSAEISDDDIPF